MSYLRSFFEVFFDVKITLPSKHNLMSSNESNLLKTYLMIWWRDWSVMRRMLEPWRRRGGHDWVPITRVGTRGWGHNVSLWGCSVSIVSPVVIWCSRSGTLWGCQFLASILKDPFDIETIGGASLVVRAPFQILRQFSGSRIINHARLVFTDGIC